MQCDMPTRTARTCKREATVFYVKRVNGALVIPGGEVIVKAYCKQHDTATNHARLLRIAPWEYDRRVEA